MPKKSIISGANTHEVAMKNLLHKACAECMKLKNWHQESQFNANVHAVLQIIGKMLKENVPALAWSEK